MPCLIKAFKQMRDRGLIATREPLCEQCGQEAALKKVRKSCKVPDGGRGNPVVEKTTATKVIQFNWRRHWSKKIAPYLHERLVQLALNVGMKALDGNWTPGDGPFAYGAIGFNTRIVKGKLSWYQPLNRCHYIALFSMAIGVLTYPDLDWRFVSGDRHTVPVGYDTEGNPRVVMDILLFDDHTAAESIALAQQDMPTLRAPAKIRKLWGKLIQAFIDKVVPKLKARARALRQSRGNRNGSGANMV
jgi:hypothetical protein